MEIKCPKCRYRFEVWRGSGVRELSCVCPRCGTPFSYELPEDEPAAHAAEVTDGEEEHYKPSVIALQAVGNKAGSGLQQDKMPSPAPAAEKSTAPPVGPQPYSTGPRPDTGTVRKKKSPFGCGFKGCLIALLALFALILFGPHAGHSDESYVAEDAAGGTTVEAIEEIPVDSFDTSVTKQDARPTPDWVFGRWQIATEYGNIEVHIADKWISETSDGGTSHATFYYTPGQLNCFFSDDGHQVKTYYRLDEDKHLIDAGEGMWMTKKSDH
ncbi:zinc ribbon domain-containing protein [Prevotella sp. oral taxon 376]|uniref:FmdB family zinc ribbon protein n=1 Tax=Prevotella sp. oral taxon 376 TaxID=712466 RepID=UPI0011B29516|nr:zinc ribbon domain-containing protein [Prevotella sp. oral taxon 376]